MRLRQIFSIFLVLALMVTPAWADAVKPEDNPHVSGDPGSMCLAVRNDTLAALAGTDGDYAPLQVDANGALFTSSAGALASSEYAEDSAHTTTDVGTFILGVANNDLSNDAAANDYTQIATGTSGAVYATIDRRSQGQDTTGLLKREDDPHTSLDTGVAMLGVRNDSLAALATTDGDYSPIQVDTYGSVYVNTMANVGTIWHGSSADSIAFKAINVDGADSDEIVAAVAGDKIRVLGYTVVCDGAVNITFEEGGGTDLTGAMPLAANGGVAQASSTVGVFETSAGQALNLLKSAAQSCDGHLTYVVID